MGNEKNWDNAFTGTDLRGTVEHSASYGGALSFMRRRYTRELAGVDVAVTGIPLDHLAGINLIGMDLMEVAPAYDVGEITALAGASIAAELLCLYASKPE